MIYGIAYYMHDNGVYCGETIVGRQAGDLQHEAERLGATTYRDQYQSLNVRINGEWVSL